MKTREIKATDRDKQQAPDYEWIFSALEPRGMIVTVRASCAIDAYQTAENTHPGVQWAYINRRECRCHDRIDCAYAWDVCTVCGRQAQRFDMGMFPAVDGMGPLVCGPCYRCSLGLTLSDAVAQVADVRGLGIAAGDFVFGDVPPERRS